MNKHKVFKIIILAGFILLISVISIHAQPGDPPGGGGGGDPVGGAGVPIDGGILSVLLAVGLLFSFFVKKKTKVGEETK